MNYSFNFQIQLNEIIISILYLLYLKCFLIPLFLGKAGKKLSHIISFHHCAERRQRFVYLYILYTPLISFLCLLLTPKYLIYVLLNISIYTYTYITYMCVCIIYLKLQRVVLYFNISFT